jgi:hypothetical protein
MPIASSFSTLEFTFSFVPTEDQSLSLRIENPGTQETNASPASSESMHSLKGAFSETVYIYGSAIEKCLDEGFTPRILSLGLGMGYVEVLAAALILKKAEALNEGERKSLLASAGGESFELLAPLRDWFTNWLLGRGEVPAEFRAAYEAMLERTAQHVGLEPANIQAYLAELVREGRWRIREALAADTVLGESFGCICFDAFSSKTSPELWTEDFLKEFFTKACAPQCVLSTYACTGALKRALKASGFEVTIREGFSSKRDSTFAVRHT